MIYTISKSGKMYNIEDAGTKTHLYDKYNLPYTNFDEWDTTIFAGRKCFISAGLWRRKRFLKLLPGYSFSK